MQKKSTSEEFHFSDSMGNLREMTINPRDINWGQIEQTLENSENS